MPERFELAYTGADNAEHRPVMIHRALMGSFERFIGILIEHYAGEFPLWLAPVQALVLPVADRHLDYAAAVAERLGAAGLRARVDDRGESIGRKIREAELAKVPVHAGGRRPRGRVGHRGAAPPQEGDSGSDAASAQIASRLAAKQARLRLYCKALITAFRYRAALRLTPPHHHS